MDKYGPSVRCVVLIDPFDEPEEPRGLPRTEEVTPHKEVKMEDFTLAHFFILIYRKNVI